MRSSRPIHRTRLVRILFISAIAITLISIGLHIWFKYNARKVLKRYISEQSNGRIQLELSSLDLNLFLNRLQIREADLISTDSLHESITYHVKFRKLTIRVASVWALLFKNELKFDSIKLHDPLIDVMQWRKDTSQLRIKDELSIPQEMGKVYRSMLSALDEFGIQRIIINNAQIRLINKMKPGAEPVTVSKIFFNLARDAPGNNIGDAKKEKEQTIELRTTNQDIAMPGGRHRLAFRSFKLQLQRQRIEFDSCTVTASPTDTSKSNYRVFFKKLFMTGVDFNAMSSQNVIRADSVYCEEPHFDFDLYKSITAKKKTTMPDVQKIIQELSGNFDLAFVGIKNAGIHFDIHGKKRRSFNNSDKDNFEMRGFRINPDSTEPVSIKRFEMTLRDYHLFNGDSSSAFSFDSLQLLNNRITLNNFSVSSQSGRNKVRSEVNITVPYFQLTDLDWYQLIFDQKLAAEEAALLNPVIYFKRKEKVVRGKKFDLFSALENIDTLVELNRVSITSGHLDMQMNQRTSFNIQDLDLDLHSNKMLESATRAGLRRSIEHLSFTNGVLRSKNITARLQNARFTGNNLIYTDRLSISSSNNSIAGTVNNVRINNLLFDEAEEGIELDGLEWASAVLSVKALPPTGKKNNNSIHFRNISGKNTRINFSSGPLAISTFVNSLQLSSLEKDNGPVTVNGFYSMGKDLLLTNNNMKISADAYNINDNHSSLEGIQFQQHKGRDSLYVTSPLINFDGDINAMIRNDVHLPRLQVSSPVIRYSKWETPITDTTKKRQPIRIDNFSTKDPDIFIATHRNDSVSIINLPRSGNSSIQAAGIVISAAGIQMRSFHLNTHSATFIKTTGELIGIEKGDLEADISDLYLGKKDGRMNWDAVINTFSINDTNGVQLGKKNNLRFSRATLGNLHLSSALVPGIGKMIKANISAWLRIPFGEYSDSARKFKWYNAAYDNNSRTLRMDSLQFQPVLSLDSSLANAPYQFDYTSIQTGAVTIKGLNAEQYEKDSSFIADSITISKPLMSIYRDKQKPDNPYKKNKPLPVDLLKVIGLPVTVGNMNIIDGEIDYTERNAKSRQEGTLMLTHLNGRIENIRNHDIAANDSLSLLLKGYLMDSAYMDISVKQSYTDPMSGFLFKVKINPTSLTFLNPLIVPLSNVKLTSGFLDSLSMQAIGKNDMAFGEMKMFYHNLHIKLIKEGDPDKTTFGKNVLSFLANAFLIKDNNTSRTGVVFYKREATQSFPKYILKMTLSGAASSVGAKSNKKYRKAYQKEITNKK
jgi:hypothetical protein